MKDEREREKGWDGGRGMWKRNHLKRFHQITRVSMLL
jgi:hypothetical protein